MRIRKHQPHQFKKIFFILPGLLVVGGIYYLTSTLLLAGAVECYTQYGPCPTNYVTDLEWIKNHSLLTPLPENQVSTSLKKYIEVKNVNLYRRLPKTLVVSVELRKPLGTLGPDVLGAQAISDEEGLILGESQNQTLPFLYSTVKPQAGEKISSDQIKALQRLSQVSLLTQSPVSGRLDGQDLTIYLSNEQKVVLNLVHSPSNWYATLQVILERSKIHSKIQKVIDLRFTDPIITF